MAEFTKACVPEVVLDEDRMVAKLKLQLKEDGKEYSIDDLKAFLESENVKIGILDNVLLQMIDQEIYDRLTIVARGKEPVDGKDGYYIFQIQNVEQEKSPKVLENGMVEYVHTVEYVTVEEGDLLAEYISATNGEYGYTLDNKIKTPKRGRELPRLKGKGFRFEEGKYYATQFGKVDITDETIRITSVLEVNHDVDINYGHIDFKGDVNIRGDVHSGIQIKASGNIEIKGHVGNCFIEAGKNIVIQNGMQGKLTGCLKAGGDIFCKFFENVNAQATGNIVVRSVLNSRLAAEGTVTVEGRESIVLGGSVHAIQGMEISQAGNGMEVATKLVAGVLPQTMERNADLIKLIKKIEEEVDLLDRAARVMERMAQTNITKETANRRRKIIQAKIIKAAELRRCQEEKKQNEILIDSGKDVNVVIQNIIYPGCRVEIAGVGINVKEEIKHAKFLLKNGEIEAALLY